MTKLCWKCGNPHEDGDAFCVKCGASFATEGMKYQTDGRTVSNKDDSAYLSAPPPKYKKSHGKAIFAAIIILGVIAVLIVMGGGLNHNDSPDYDGTYDYEEWSRKSTEQGTVIEFVVYMKNVSGDLMQLDSNCVCMTDGKNVYKPMEYSSWTLMKGQMKMFYFNYLVKGGTSDIPTIAIDSEYTFKYSSNTRS